MKIVCISIISVLFLLSCSANVIIDSESIIIDIEPQDIHDKPRNLSESNALKRAFQISQVEWTPFLDIPNNVGFYNAGSVVRGMPYSSAKEFDKFVGLEVSFETFMTAVHNPRSVLYTENISKAPYHGTNCASYYGVVCSSTVNYALGLKLNYITACLDTLSLFTRIPLQTPESIQLCDVLWSQGHEVMVYDIVRAPTDSTIKSVSILESVGTKTRIHGYTYKDFQKRWENVGWVIYRYNCFDKAIEYEPSPFVLLEGEFTAPYKYNDVICTSRGNRAVYREGESVIVNVLDTTYTNLVLYRNNQLVENRNCISSNEEYNGLQYGSYSVIAADNDGNKSDAIVFDVVDTNVHAKKNGNVVGISFNSEFGSPEYIKLCQLAGGSVIIRELLATEKSLGQVVINWPVQYKELYCKVMFSTPNGMVTNEPILIRNK